MSATLDQQAATRRQVSRYGEDQVQTGADLNELVPVRIALPVRGQLMVDIAGWNAEPKIEPIPQGRQTARDLEREY